MIPVQEAIKKAAEFASALWSTSPLATKMPPPNTQLPMRLEEVEQGEVQSRKVWLITLSLPIASMEGLSLADRQYKIFAVDRETGEVLSAKIREFAGTHV